KQGSILVLMDGKLAHRWLTISFAVFGIFFAVFGVWLLFVHDAAQSAEPLADRMMIGAFITVAGSAFGILMFLYHPLTTVTIDSHRREICILREARLRQKRECYA